jgi:hypothetical protein
MINKLFLSLFFLSSILTYSAEHAVTYEFSGGRLGDNLLAYSHAKWVSYVYGIPLLYKPFAYSDQLVLDDVEKPYTIKEISKFYALQKLDYRLPINLEKEVPTLYVLSYFSEFDHERFDYAKWPYLHVNWKEPGFSNLLKSLIKPKVPLPEITLPENEVTVAAHVRRGTAGVDSFHLPSIMPLRCPPYEFFIDQIRYLYALFHEKPMYVYIFTDQDPEKIAAIFQNDLNGLNIRFDYRTDESQEHVLEDLFAMTRFDCLIRPDSNFSYLASILGDFKVVIHPAHFSLTDGLITIDQVRVQINGEF